MIGGAHNMQAELLPETSLHRSLLVSISVALAIAVGCAGYWSQFVLEPNALPIRKIAVEGEFRKLDPQRIRDLVTDAVRGGFFDIDVQGVRDRILLEPWLAEASVRRVWPDTLVVTVREQQAVAYWGEHSLLNADGDIFAPPRASFPPHLTPLTGPVGSEIEVLTQLTTLTERFAPHGLQVAGIALSERRAWEVKLSNGIRLRLGRAALSERVHRFAQIYASILRPVEERVDVVDLRYTNGFALKMRAAVSRDPACDEQAPHTGTTEPCDAARRLGTARAAGKAQGLLMTAPREC